MLTVVPSPIFIPPSLKETVEVSYDGHSYFFTNVKSRACLELSKDWTRQNDSLWIAHVKEKVGRRVICTNDYVPQRHVVDYVLKALSLDRSTRHAAK